MKLKDIIAYLDNIAPFELQDSYDNSGLILGNVNSEINKAIISLDCTEEIIDFAIMSEAQLIISHHPAIMIKKNKFLYNNSYVDNIILKAIKNDISLIAFHTNIDYMQYGINNIICDKIGLINKSILSPHENILRKLIVYIPNNYVEIVRNAIFKAGAGKIGNYTNCSYSSNGIGTFIPIKKSKPFIGNKNFINNINETKLEVIFPKYFQNDILDKLYQSHPYEEISYEISSILNNNKYIGAGMIGDLYEEIDTIEFFAKLKSKMDLSVFKHTRVIKNKIKRVAVCGGRGVSLIKLAINNNADIFITSDFKYHEFFEANNDIILIDIGHYESEQYIVDFLIKKINNYFNKEIAINSKICTNPIKYF